MSPSILVLNGPVSPTLGFSFNSFSAGELGLAAPVAAKYFCKSFFVCLLLLSSLLLMLLFLWGSCFV